MKKQEGKRQPVRKVQISHLTATSALLPHTSPETLLNLFLMECLTYLMHAVKIKVIDNFILICTGTDRLDLITP